ncbi:hypothetical protein ACQEVI_26295 [Promicromonospora sp. CA-289599]|uniref:hypothetical protein n=1 Tax=Promicromonospora sp. CA-289599 TaxID=3240014 RepID=UPI003D8C9711
MKPQVQSGVTPDEFAATVARPAVRGVAPGLVSGAAVTVLVTVDWSNIVAAMTTLTGGREYGLTVQLFSAVAAVGAAVLPHFLATFIQERRNGKKVPAWLIWLTAIVWIALIVILVAARAAGSDGPKEVSVPGEIVVMGNSSTNVYVIYGLEITSAVLYTALFGIVTVMIGLTTFLLVWMLYQAHLSEVRRTVARVKRLEALRSRTLNEIAYLNALSKTLAKPLDSRLDDDIISASVEVIVSEANALKHTVRTDIAAVLRDPASTTVAKGIPTTEAIATVMSAPEAKNR